MATQFERFKGALEKMLMLDQADLDFGIYRIMNQKRTDIEKYLNNELKKQVAEAVSGSSTAELESLKAELERAIQNARDLGVAPESLPKVKDLRAKLSEGGDTESLENEVYSHLTTFFSRYYDGGDFMSQRRYKKDVYAIPYEGEEVKLHWANADQYYIKTGEYFRSYRFTLTGGKAVEFTLKEATVEQNNNLAQNNMERRFALYEEQPIEVVGDTLHINFTYELYPKAKKQNDFIVKAYNTVKDMIPTDFAGVFEPKPTEKDRNRTLLQKHLKDYVARNTFDYFIHKDLNGFLSRELDFFIKNEILVIDDIDAQNPKDFVQHLSVIKAIKTVGKKIITFLASLEDFQKKLWLKKKFVIQTDYCITLDRVPKELYPDICANDKQREEWVKLFAIDEIKADAFTHAYTNPLTTEFLSENQYLVLDTALFSSDFKSQLLSSIDDIDEQCDGLMINSDNFQALNLLKCKYSNSVAVIYVDPPYNTSASEILYKNSYKHSSWLSLLNDRLILGKNLLSNDGVQCTTIDDVEGSRLRLCLENVYDENPMVVGIRVKPSGRPIPNGFAISHEYAFFSRKNESTAIQRLQHSDDQNARYRQRDEKGPYLWELLRKAGSNSFRKNRPTMFYPIYLNELDGTMRIPNMQYDTSKEEYIVEDVLLENEVKILPMKDDGTEGCWYFGLERAIKEVHEFKAEKQDNGMYSVYRRRRKNDGVQPTTFWEDSKYSATEHGTDLLKRIFGEQEVFSYPKSIFAVEDSLTVSGAKEGTLTLDYFAGSGTTGHAIINLNREDNGGRKYILCEMGEYFDTVTKPRIQKVIYSKDWNNGKPVSREGCSHCFKYMRLEQYEDTLNNLMVKSSMTADNGEFYHGYMLGYLLDTETKDSLFNLEWFRNPWNTKLFITRQNETKEENIDLIETFNYLIGLNVETILYPKEGICTVEGVTRTGERTLVIWRNVDMIDNEALNKFFEKQAYSTKDSEFDRIYVNGDCNLENLRTDEESWKVILTEKEFAKRMFEDC
ncbi:MAG: site-specific DNA-methyltransferase [Bacteroidales bacterium]|nr:site-specific DNA-methyltransferase [Bacteroidales bacterium]